jgi:hypothetical protein
VSTTISRRTGAAAAADVLAILVFVAIGRRSHDEGSAIGGILSVAAPFLIGLAAGWAVSRAWTHPMRVESAFIIWPVTIVVGMVLRHTVFDRGTAVSFIIVATCFTGLFLVGWRLVANRATGSHR